MGTMAMLCCPAISKTNAVLIAWVITLIGQPPCRISSKVETKDINKTNCTDRRITGASIPDQSLDLLIYAVALDHDGLYSYDRATLKGNFQKKHDLHLLGK